MQDISIGKKISSFLVRFIGIFLVFYSLLAVIIFYEYLSVAKDQGYMAVDFDFQQNTSISTIEKIIKYSPADLSGLMVGDTVTHVNNIPLVNSESISQALGFPKKGEIVNLTILKNNQPETKEIQIIEIPLYDKILETLFRTIPVFIMIGFILAGLWSVFKNPYQSENLLIAMFCFSFGCFIYASIQFSVTMENEITRALYFYEVKRRLILLGILAPSFWLYLFMIFPKKLRFYEKNKFLSFLLIFLIPLITLVSVLFGVQLLFYIVLILIVIYMVMGVIILGINSRDTNNALEKRQIRLVLLGIKYGSLSIFTGWISYLLAFIFFQQNTLLVSISLSILLAGEIGGLIIPLTFMNSLAKNKLLETEGALRRRVRYVLFTIMLLTIYLSVIFIVGKLSINMLNMTDPTLVIIFVLFLSLTFTPLHKKLLNLVDEKFYPERTRYASSFRAFIDELPRHVESEEVMESLTLWLQTTLKISPIIPVTVQTNGINNPFRMLETNSVINKVKQGNKFFWDEITDKSIVQIHRDEMRWAREHDIAITIPMMIQGEVIGLLNVGKKEGNEDFSTDDLDILTQASNQTAFTLRNLKLQQEYIQKKRQDKELEMARRIQKQLLPQQLPSIKGLDCFGISKPCFEVAGDYYDIITMEDGNTVFVIADVSGKGAGAALIMANMQASIRLGIHLSDSLSDFVSRVNSLIFNNTSDSEFVTFFMGIWVPAESALYYVNAGQNPPIILKNNGDIKILEATGLILGIIPGEKYETRKIILEYGDLGLIYTDGLEEALDQNDELFGTERIINSLIQNKALPPADVIKNLISEMNVFCKGNPIHDDLTMIVMKRTKD